jgi:hypothetical protein
VDSILLVKRMKKAFEDLAVKNFVPEILSPKVENFRK